MVQLHPEINRPETIACSTGIGAHFPPALYDVAHLYTHLLDLFHSQRGLTTSGRSQPERVVLDKLQTLHSDDRVAELACQATAATTALHWYTPFDRVTTKSARRSATYETKRLISTALITVATVKPE